VNNLIFFEGSVPKEGMNSLETLQNVLKGVALLPNFNELVGSLDNGPTIQAVEKGQEVDMERCGAEHLNKGESRGDLCVIQNVPYKGQEF